MTVLDVRAPVARRAAPANRPSTADDDDFIPPIRRSSRTS
jgi:hypothetical protein